MIKVQLEFHSVPEAIIALNAIMNLPEVKAKPALEPHVKGRELLLDARRERKGRADKGQKRGEYKPRETEPAAGAAQVNSAVPAGATSSEAVQTRSEAKPVESTTSAPTTAAPSTPAATIGDKDAEAQKAMEILHGKKGLDACRVLLGQFGVSRIREIPTARRVEFLDQAAKAAA